MAHFLDSRLRENDPPEADLRRTEGLVVDSPQEGGVPQPPNRGPKIEDPPQEEWGPGG